MFRPVRVLRLLALSSLFAATIAAAGCAPQTQASTTSTSSADVPPQVEPPCANAELHDRVQYSVCTANGIDNRETDLWCCPDGTQKKTDSLIAATGQVCSTPVPTSGVPATPACKSPMGPKRWEPCDTSDQGSRTEFNKACSDAGCATETYNYDQGDPNASPPRPPSCWTRCL